jgi:hypothetical protein
VNFRNFKTPSMRNSASSSIRSTITVRSTSLDRGPPVELLKTLKVYFRS